MDEYMYAAPDSARDGTDAVNFDETALFAVRRRDMTFVSDYFRRDARRYDNGFELY